MGNDIALELETFGKMLELFCRREHGGKELCPGCRDLLLYSAGRLAKCPHHPKPACKDCPTHCFSPENRARVREVMRSSGPRMALAHPLLVLRHFLR